MKIHPEPAGARPPGLAALWVAARRAREPGSNARSRAREHAGGQQQEPKDEIVLADKY